MTSTRDTNYGNNPLHYPNDRALGQVLLADGEGKGYFFGVKTLKEKLENIAHYSGCGLQWRLP